MNSGRLVAGITLGVLTGFGAEFQHEFAQPSRDRWMYPFNATPGARAAAPVFSTFGDDAGVDTRHGQFLIGWDTEAAVSPGHPRAHYWITAARLELTVLRPDSFIHDPTPDPFESGLPPEDPRATPDSDPGRPIELFGAGFRNEFTAWTFEESSPFGPASTGGRNAFAAGFNPARQLVDVGNNVGKTNEAYSPFPTRPFAIGIVTDVAAGDPVPAGATVRFDVNVADPDVRGYLQESLRSGRLWLTVTWLGESSGLSGTPTYPDFATRDNLVYDPPRLTVEGVLIGPDDDDEDGLPDDWERLFLGGRDFSGDDDPDGDGVTNITEWLQGTDPGSEHSVLRIQPLRAVADSGAGFAITDDGPGAPRVEVSTDLKEWREATGRLEFLEPRNGHWIPNSESAEAVQFFRLRRSDPDPESPPAP